MELKRDLAANKIYLVDNDSILLETDYIGGEFVICICTHVPIIINKELDVDFYVNLEQLLESDYIFDSTGLSSKKDNQIIWFSDQYCDIENEKQRKMVNRLILKKINDEIVISFENPYFEEKGIKRKNNYIAFSPCGNGLFSKNINSGMSFQDDVVLAFERTLKQEKNSSQSQVLKKRKFKEA